MKVLEIITLSFATICISVFVIDRFVMSHMTGRIKKWWERNIIAEETGDIEV